jgi:hypothetical protein
MPAKCSYCLFRRGRYKCYNAAWKHFFQNGPVDSFADFLNHRKKYKKILKIITPENLIVFPALTDIQT